VNDSSGKRARAAMREKSQVFECVISRIYYPFIISGNKLRDVEIRAENRSTISKYDFKQDKKNCVYKLDSIF